MRKFYMLLAVAFLTTTTYGQTQIYFDDFEDNSLEGYTLYNLDGLTPDDPGLANMADSAWTIQQITAQGWTHNLSAFSVSWYVNDAGPSDDWLVTPAIAIAGEAVLEWDALAITSSGNFRDRYMVYVSSAPDLETISESAVLIFDTGAPGEETTPQHRTVDLAALGYENETIYICFRNNTQPFGSNPGGPGNGGNELVIDNIEVTDNSVVSTRNISVYSDLSLLPNPSFGDQMQLRFQVETSSATTLEVLDISGKILQISNLGILSGGEHLHTIKLPGISPGVYLIRLRSENSTTVLRAVFN